MMPSCALQGFIALYKKGSLGFTRVRYASNMVPSYPNRHFIAYFTNTIVYDRLYKVHDGSVISYDTLVAFCCCCRSLLLFVVPPSLGGNEMLRVLAGTKIQQPGNPFVGLFFETSSKRRAFSIE